MEKEKTEYQMVKEILDRLGREWFAYHTDGNISMKEKLQGEIFTVISKHEWIFKNRKEKLHDEDLFWDAVSEFYIRDLQNFQPVYNGEESSFFAFAMSRIANRQIDCYNKESENKKYTKEENGKKVKEKRQKISLDEREQRYEESGEGGKEWSIINEENPLKNPEVNVLQDERICELILLFTGITERLSGRQNNETKRAYFRLFATEYITGAIQLAADNIFMRKRERDILMAVKEEFLDYYMVKRCRSIGEIQRCPMKKHCEVEEGSLENSEISVPFSLKLYVTYLQRIQKERVGESAVSMQRKSFKECYRGMLE